LKDKDPWEWEARPTIVRAQDGMSEVEAQQLYKEHKKMMQEHANSMLGVNCSVDDDGELPFTEADVRRLGGSIGKYTEDVGVPLYTDEVIDTDDVIDCDDY